MKEIPAKIRVLYDALLVQNIPAAQLLHDLHPHYQEPDNQRGEKPA